MEEIIERKLLLAKEFYLNGERQGQLPDPLERIISIHNFHIAVEITLRTIALHFEIRREKTLNIDFESLLNEVENHPPFRREDKKLPYRQDMRNLNAQRNLVQHQGIEPDSNAVAEWRVLTRRFLVRAYQSYFELDFEALSRVSLVTDETLRKHFEVAHAHLRFTNYLEAACFAKSAYEIASRDVFRSLNGVTSPYEGEPRVRGETRENAEFMGRAEPITRALSEQSERIVRLEKFSAAIAAGIDPHEYERFASVAPLSALMANGRTHLGGWPRRFPRVDEKEKEGEAEWMVNFVLDTVLRWQRAGQEFSTHEGGFDPMPFLEEELENMCVKSLLSEGILQETPPA